MAKNSKQTSKVVASKASRIPKADATVKHQSL